MAKRRRSTSRRRVSRGVLEWVTETYADSTADRTTQSNTTTVIDLDLNPEEVAEIYKIESMIEIDYTGEIDGYAHCGIALSTDPSASVDAAGVTSGTLDDLEDEEVFYLHRKSVDGVLVGTGASFIVVPETDQKTVDFDFPVKMLVGRNIGMNTSIVEGAAGDVNYWAFLARVWFRRRKGAPDEILSLIQH